MSGRADNGLCPTSVSLALLLLLRGITSASCFVSALLPSLLIEEAADAIRWSRAPADACGRPRCKGTLSLSALTRWEGAAAPGTPSMPAFLNDDGTNGGSGSASANACEVSPVPEVVGVLSTTALAGAGVTGGRCIVTRCSTEGDSVTVEPPLASACDDPLCTASGMHRGSVESSRASSDGG
jgi:hypothetical protein